MSDSKPELWLRGPVSGVPKGLQPVAHALLQAQEEVEALLDGFPEHLLWERPGGAASAAFHLQHMAGVVDRLFTYARGESLDDRQLAALAAEGTRPDQGVRGADLVEAFGSQVARAIDQLCATDEGTLSDACEVGRKRLPSTVGGLLFHAAEHTQRHVGQLLVTVRVVQERRGS